MLLYRVVSPLSSRLKRFRMTFTMWTTAGSSILSICARRDNSKNDGKTSSLRIVASRMDVVEPEAKEEEEEEEEDIADIFNN